MYFVKVQKGLKCENAMLKISLFLNRSVTLPLHPNPGPLYPLFLFLSLSLALWRRSKLSQGHFSIRAAFKQQKQHAQGTSCTALTTDRPTDSLCRPINLNCLTQNGGVENV
jgi:hypothetical protein